MLKLPEAKSYARNEKKNNEIRQNSQVVVVVTA